MSQQDDDCVAVTDSENDIWEYKPLKKTKRKATSEPTNNDGPVAKKRLSSKRISKGETAAKPAKGNVKPARKGRGHKATSNKTIPPMPPSTTPPQANQIGRPLATDNVDVDNNELSSGGFCPICQMPFSMLVAQSLQRWHVTECLDTPGDDSKECPDGVQCSSTIQSHYKSYSHAVLAHSRATNDAVLLSLSKMANESPSCSFSAVKGANDMSSCGSVSSQDSDLNIFTLSSPRLSPSNIHCGTSTPSKPTNALLLLRSPGPEDIRKKKGWSSTVKDRKTTRASQDSKTKVLTPVNADRESQAINGGFVKAPPSPMNDDGFSYSPLSEYPPDLKINTTKLRKQLFPLKSASEHENDGHSVILLDDSLSMSGDQEFLSGDTQVMLVSSSADINQPARSTAANKNVLTSSLSCEKEEPKEVNCNKTSSGLQLQSPQSIVLERLREHISDPNRRGILHSNSFNERPSHIKTEETSAYTQQVPSSSQISSSQLPQGSMASSKGQAKAGPASGLKQMDIGVFFGLKPLKEKEAEGAAPERKVGGVSVRARRERAGGRQGRRGGAGVRVAEPDGNTGASVAEQEETTDDVNTQSTRAEGRRGGWRRWGNRRRGDGEPEEPKRCPFYKKIPGTKFVVDAFQYGVVDGVTAYFLTHFHSDHYRGLRKNSTFPIYCNKITGNLVKSKLKVQEEYIHVLPMNTEVTVEGVRVVLLDANHCPGAAMLLLFLPDGQVVLHVGDFRASPSMERYPELLSCRVQSLYLDTTYCSPEYTFPSQEDVVNFAANTAFERVTLNPRTLVVCGSYSVGKEKVFLALAEVLGSKVCMSRDKFNTMCCLESERVRQLITTDWKAAQVHVLPMMQLSFKNLKAHLGRFSGRYDQLVAFKPTGWTFSQNAEGVENILPQTDGSISIYGVPYSEHSSFLELKRFVQWLRPLKIIPTVNVGSRDSRKAMEKCFREWLMETNGDAS